MQRTGHTVKQYDWLVGGEDLTPMFVEIERFAPDMLSISIRNIDNVDSFSGAEGWYLEKIRDLVAALRARVKVPIVVGGPAMTIMPEAIAEYLEVDHAVVGEGERSLPALAEDLAAGRKMPRVIARRPPLEGDQFAAPLFESDIVNYYLKHSGMVNLQTKRGCPYRCSYCSYPHLEGTSFRVRNPQLVVDELERLQREHQVERVFFTDSVFNDPQGRYLEVCEEMIRRELNIRWAAFFRPQGMGREELALMKRSGLYALELGTDAGADKTLAGINKNLTYADIFAVNDACIAERLPAAHYVMFGGPDEDENTVLEALDNIQRLGASVVFAFSGIRIHPGAPLHQRAIDDGVISAGTSLLEPVYYFSPKVDHEWMEQELERSFAGKKTRVFPPSEGLKRIAVMKDFGFRGLLWDQLVRFPKDN
jgi:radical SAM superfamily enzyme YgiQ (UPF0313 family)